MMKSSTLTRECGVERSSPPIVFLNHEIHWTGVLRLPGIQEPCDGGRIQGNSDIPGIRRRRRDCLSPEARLQMDILHTLHRLQSRQFLTKHRRWIVRRPRGQIGARQMEEEEICGELCGRVPPRYDSEPRFLCGCEYSLQDPVRMCVRERRVHGSEGIWQSRRDDVMEWNGDPTRWEGWGTDLLRCSASAR